MTRLNNPADERWMRAAIALARYGEGRVAPNPAVGCVIVKDGVLVGRGYTAVGGRPHAETEALAEAGDKAKGASVYVTLEPCAHHGKTPPCCTALISAGIARVVTGASDPDDKVSGQGVKALKAAGIEVTQHVLHETIKVNLAGYVKHRTKNRPLVTAKIATSLDGRIALADGRSQWITGVRARGYVHDLRSRCDAIITGMGTVRADDPLMTVRLEGVTHSPLRVIMAREAGLDDQSALVKTAKEYPVLQAVTEASIASANRLADKGVEVITLEAGENKHVKPDALLSHLAERGMTSVLIEAGGKLMTSFLSAGLIDRLCWIRSEGLLGDDSLPAIAALGLDTLEQGKIFHRVSFMMLGDDCLEILERA